MKTDIAEVTTGQDLRAQRMARGIKAAFVAEQMGISASFLSDLERDRRNWTEDNIQKFKKAIGLV